MSSKKLAMKAKNKPKGTSKNKIEDTNGLCKVVQTLLCSDTKKLKKGQLKLKTNLQLFLVRQMKHLQDSSESESDDSDDEDSSSCDCSNCCDSDGESDSCDHATDCDCSSFDSDEESDSGTDTDESDSGSDQEETDDETESEDEPVPSKGKAFNLKDLVKVEIKSEGRNKKR